MCENFLGGGDAYFQMSQKILKKGSKLSFLCLITLYSNFDAQLYIADATVKIHNRHGAKIAFYLELLRALSSMVKLVESKSHKISLN